MNRWLVSLLTVLIVGCGESSNSNAEPGAVEELDGGGGPTAVHHSAGGIDLEEMKKSPLFHEFDVDLFSSDPVQHAVNFTVSSADTYKISLKTLDFLMEGKRFPLVQSDKIIQNGLPKVIAPIGYSVSLEVSGNQVIAVIKSTTQPEKSTQTVPVDTENNDIIVGDLSALSLLFSGIQKDLNQPTMNGAPLTISATALNRYMSYNHGGEWFVQLSKTKVGMDHHLSTQLSKQWNMLELGTIQLSGQALYNVRDRKHVNATSFKYSTAMNDSGFQGHFIVSTLLNSPFQTAVGIGCQMTTYNQGKLSFDVVASSLDANVTVGYVLSY
jgi:hypothetical protein